MTYKLTEVLNGPSNKWKWLAYALFSHMSNSSVQKLILSDIDLTAQDVAEIAAVLQFNCPQPVLDQDAANWSLPPAYGYVDVAQRTELRCILGNLSDVIIVLLDSYRCRAMYNPNAMKNQAHVVVPGYGICEVSVGGGLNEFVRDSVSNLTSLTPPANNIISLELDLKEVEEGGLVAKLLALAGKTIQNLSICYAGEIHLDIDLTDIATTCPVLEYLFLRDCNVSFTDHASMRGWGINRLIIEGSSEIVGLPMCLNDHNYRIPRELIELRILAPESRCHSSWMRELNVSQAYVMSLEQLDGAFLPMTMSKFPLASKIAMISVVRFIRLDSDTFPIHSQHR